jgi:ADP-L-glycero-D-manno-heptose 6-epimerase
MAKIIVTGGAGFIGSNVVKALNERGEADILVVDDLNDPLKERNLAALKYSAYLDKRELRPAISDGSFAEATAVIHLGACSSTTERDEAYLDDNNTAYTDFLARWCLDGSRRLVYASSAATYGAGECGYSDDESIIPNLKPLNLYGWSKQKFDMIALRSGYLDRIAGLKFFNVFGPGEGHKGTMRSMICKSYAQILEIGRIGLFKSYRPEYPDGGQVRDFVYVKDVVAEILFFLDNPSKNGIYNCGTGHARSWVDLATAVFRAMGREPAIDFIEMPEELRGQYQYFTEADMAKTRAAGFTRPFMPLEDAVQDYVQNYLQRN